MNPTIVILAAGLGTRMKSGLAKALHPLAGLPLIQHVLNAASGVEPEKIVLVLGHQADQVKNALGNSRSRSCYRRNSSEQAMPCNRQRMPSQGVPVRS